MFQTWKSWELNEILKSKLVSFSFGVQLKTIEKIISKLIFEFNKLYDEQLYKVKNWTSTRKVDILKTFKSL